MSDEAEMLYGKLEAKDEELMAKDETIRTLTEQNEKLKAKFQANHELINPHPHPHPHPHPQAANHEMMNLQMDQMAPDAAGI